MDGKITGWMDGSVGDRCREGRKEWRIGKMVMKVGDGWMERVEDWKNKSVGEFEDGWIRK